MTFCVTTGILKSICALVPWEQVARCPHFRLLLQSSRDFLVSFFLVTRFRWQASISQNTVSRGMNPSILSWETRAGEKLSLSEDCHRRIFRTRARKKNERRFDGSTARFPEVPFDPTVNYNRINTRNDNKVPRPNVFKMNLREISE